MKADQGLQQGVQQGVQPAGLRRAGLPRWLPDWPAAFYRLLLYCGVSSIGWVAFDSFLTPFLRDYGVPVMAIGIFHGLAGAVGAPAAAIGGIVADRWGRRAALALGGTIRVLGWMLVLALPGTTYLTFVAAMLGMGWAASSAYMAMIAETSPKGRRAFGFAVTGVVENIASMIVPLATGILADRFGLRTALALALVPGVLTVLMVGWLRETGGRSLRQLGLRRQAADIGDEAAAGVAQGDAAAGVGGTSSAVSADASQAVDATSAVDDAAQGAVPSTEVAPSAASGLRYMVSPAGRGALLMGLIWMVTGLQFALIGPAKPLYVTDRFGVSYSGLGMVAMLGSVGMILGQLVGGRVADRIGQSRLMAMCVSASGLLHLVLPVAPTVAWYAAVLVLSNFAGWIAAPCWGAVSANSTPRDVRGSVTGLYTAMRAVGAASGGALFGLVYARDITLPFYLMVAGEAAVLVMVLLGTRRAWAGFGKGVIHDD